jgi:hypothetical protein
VRQRPQWLSGADLPDGPGRALALVGDLVAQRSCVASGGRQDLAQPSQRARPLRPDAADRQTQRRAYLLISWCWLSGKHPKQRAVTRREALERRAHGGSVVLADQALACVRRVIR